MLDTFRIRPSAGAQCTPNTRLLADETFSKTECPFTSCEDRQNFHGDPINTFSGNYNYQVTDISVPAVGQPLRFERTYNSLATVAETVVYSQALGYGWTHNYDSRLIFPDQPAGEAGKIILKAPHGSRLRFTINSDETYSAGPGVWTTLTRTLASSAYVYTITTVNQEQFSFNEAGYLTGHLDPRGNSTLLTRAQGITLTRVTDEVSGRYLDFGYDLQGRLQSVTDPANRTVIYGYDPNGDLTTVQDTRGYTWTYTYSGTTHLLHIVRDPQLKVLEQTFYTLVNGQPRATLQKNGANQTMAQIEYLANGQRRITDTGRVSLDTYNPRTNVLDSQTDALGRLQSYAFDGSFNRTGQTDGRGNLTQYVRAGLGLTQVMTNALGQATFFDYDPVTYHLRETIDARGTRTNYVYDDHTNLLQRIETISGSTRFAYNGWGQVLTITNRRDYPTTFSYGCISVSRG